MKVKAIKVNDNKGNTFMVNKKDSLALKPRFKSPEVKPEVKDEEKEPDFTKEELKALKDLAKKYEDLLALLEDPKSKKAKEEVEKDEDDEDADLDDKEEKEKKDEEILELSEDDDVEITEEDDEEFIDDQCSDELKHDSKKSFGSVENRNVKDSSDDEDNEIALAWAKRYGGK